MEGDENAAMRAQVHGAHDAAGSGRLSAMRAIVAVSGPVLLAFATGMTGCASARPPPTGGDGAQRRPFVDDDAAFASTVRFRGSSDCTGVLVAPAWVLTAAHCVAGVSTLPTVVATGPRGVFTRDIDSCAMHPGAFDGSTRCQEERSANAIEAVVPAHDLALVHLSAPFAPSEIAPTAWASHEPSSIAHARVRVMSWLPSEVTGDASQRIAGWNEVTHVSDGAMVTVPIAVEGRDRVSTQPGDSGSPALLEIDGEMRVVGVLSGGSAPYAVDSVFAETFEEENARWIQRLTSATAVRRSSNQASRLYGRVGRPGGRTSTLRGRASLKARSDGLAPERSEAASNVATQSAKDVDSAPL